MISKTVTLITFHGTQLQAWAKIVEQTTGKIGTWATVPDRAFGTRDQYAIALTDADREALMAHWYAASPDGSPWNHCVGFTERKPSKRTKPSHELQENP